MFERWMPGGKSGIGAGNSESAVKLADLEARRDTLIEWMKRDSTPADVRLLNDLNRQIQTLEEQSGRE